MTEWKLYLRDSSYARQGEIDDYASFEAVSRFNDVGTWTLEVDRRVALAGGLSAPGWGIILTRDGTIAFSGPATSWDQSVGDEQRLTVSGVDDTVWLKRRQASPCPTESFPPYTTQEHDVRTGACSTILRQYADANAGPSAVASRRVAGLTLGADPAAGTSVTGRARWQVLLTLLQELAISGGGVGFRVRQVGTGLEFQTYNPIDRTGTAKFSLELGNLADYQYSVTAPDATYVFVGGGGEGTARTIRERAADDFSTWGRFEGEFVDRRDTTDTAELDQAGTEALADRGTQTSLSITPIDTPQLTFGDHYDVGDRITVQLDEPIQDLVRQVTISLKPEGTTVVPGVGTASAVIKQLRAFRELSNLRRRLANLERR